MLEDGNLWILMALFSLFRTFLEACPEFVEVVTKRRETKHQLLECVTTIYSWSVVVVRHNLHPPVYVSASLSSIN